MTKVNRCLTEGRKRFFDRYEGIESGAECERWAPVLSAVADGEASAEDLLAVRPHLRNCSGCRATLRDFRSAPIGLGALVPVAVVVAGEPAAAGDPSPLMRVYEAVVGGVHERVVHSAQKLQAGVEAASTGKLAAVAASATAIAGGGVAAVDRRLDEAGATRSHLLMRVGTAAEAKPVGPARPPARVAEGTDSPATGVEAEPAPAARASEGASPARTSKVAPQEFGFDAGAPASGPADAPPEPAQPPVASSASDSAASSRVSGGGEFGP